MPTAVFAAEEDRRTTERRVTVALAAVALVLYVGVIPGEIVWKVAAHAGSSSVEQPVDRADRSGQGFNGEPAASTGRR